MLNRLTANDINQLAILGIINRDKATNHLREVQAMASDKRKRYDYRKPKDNTIAISDYYKRKNEQTRQELSFLFD